MSNKKTKQDNQKQVALIDQTEKEQARSKTFTTLRTSSLGNATLALKNIHKDEKLDLQTLGENLKKQANNIFTGDTQDIELMLIAQAQTLQALFYSAVETVPHCQMVAHVQIYSDLAFKANNSLRKTLLALNQIKNPSPATFIKQQNNAINQQINQDNLATTKPKNPKKIIENELLEAKHDKLDTRAASAAITKNPPMETMEKIHRRENTGR